MCEVQLDIDVIRYNEALTEWESGLNDAREKALLAKFPPVEPMLLDHPLVVIDSGYRIILWYLPDMFIATVDMGNLLQNSITAGKMSTGRTTKWRTSSSNFHVAREPGLIPRCINISPCWFQQGHENPSEGFVPEVSATLKGDSGLSSIIDMQRLALLSSAALRVMHPQLYRASMSTHVKLGHWVAAQGQDQMYRCLQHWASVYSSAAIVCNGQSPSHWDPKCPPEGFDILTCIGSYDHAVMNLTNLRIDLVYNPGVMVSYSGHLVRHGVRVGEGDRIVWAWFMQDSVHNYAGTPQTEFAKYNLADFTTYHLARYNHADFIWYRT
ncbi:uncharacterized protein F5147DRAFT_588748 [Suillus discolor]|uniref:2OGFeDO JBP1/TET oxygenase domain-containing protein n=1 Tax=Suillus discolor TaxID=1912936 RepID=A0A9P7ER56_9AGAM|nr:uncharacterized protein F5147DRAFT_588748 [Suillus discolor]KAG2085888.1 hypothetical protein F5147DRAFT_588748 [Suillus discolor]